MMLPHIKDLIIACPDHLIALFKNPSPREREQIGTLIELIYGLMFTGKTTHVMIRISELSLSNQLQGSDTQNNSPYVRIGVVTSAQDTRFKASGVKSFETHSGFSLTFHSDDVCSVDSIFEIPITFVNDHDVLVFDETQFIKGPVALWCLFFALYYGKRFVISSLSHWFTGTMVPLVQDLISYGVKQTQCTTLCQVCNSQQAVFNPKICKHLLPVHVVDTLGVTRSTLRSSSMQDFDDISSDSSSDSDDSSDAKSLIQIGGKDEYASVCLICFFNYFQYDTVSDTQ